MFDRAFQVINNVKALDVIKGFSFAFGVTEVQELVIAFNFGEGTQFGQLWQGIDSQGRELADIGGDYSRVTKAIKAAKGQPVNRVTLNDTGEMYQSASVEVDGQGNLIIKADTIKEGDDLQDRWGDKLLGLTKENQERLLPVLTPYLIEYFKREILK